jgi:hypothetical protein
MTTISKTVRGYLATHPKATAKELQLRFACSVAMAYRLVKENKERLAMQAAAEKIRADSAAAAQQLDTPAEPAVVTITVAEPSAVEAVTADMVNHPPHYTTGGIETIDFIEAKGLHKHYHLANAIKYISRAPYKGNYLEDLEKATWYLQREIQLQQAQAR